jgi:hypothetical protein
MHDDPSNKPLEYAPPQPRPPFSPLVRFLFIIPLTIIGFFLFLVSLVLMIVSVSLPIRIGAAAVLAGGLFLFVYWLVISYRKKYAGRPKMTAKEKLISAAVILIIVVVRIVIHLLTDRQ